LRTGACEQVLQDRPVAGVGVFLAIELEIAIAGFQREGDAVIGHLTRTPIRDQGRHVDIHELVLAIGGDGDGVPTRSGNAQSGSVEVGDGVLLPRGLDRRHVKGPRLIHLADKEPQRGMLQRRAARNRGDVKLQVDRLSRRDLENGVRVVAHRLPMVGSDCGVGQRSRCLGKRNNRSGTSRDQTQNASAD
jgi:hypothetical protein